jgi:hypothetical protein
MTDRFVNINSTWAGRICTVRGTRESDEVRFVVCSELPYGILPTPVNMRAFENGLTSQLDEFLAAPPLPEGCTPENYPECSEYLKWMEDWEK